MAGSSPENSFPGNCFSGMLTLFLCRKSLPTHPSDQLPDPDSNNPLFVDQESTLKSTTTSPGIVARLMGLESMPDLSAQRSRSFGSFLKSRSVNFIDFSPQTLTGEAQHRRVRTSVSFREAVRSSDREKPDFLILCFDAPGNQPSPQSPPAIAGFQGAKTEEKTSQERKSTMTHAKKRSANRVIVNRKGDLALEKRAVKKPARVAVESKPHRNLKNRCNRSVLDLTPRISPANKPAEKSGKSRNGSKVEHPCNKAQNRRGRRVVNDKAPKAGEGKVVCRGRKEEEEECGGSGEKWFEEICRLAEECAAELWWTCGGVFKVKDWEGICVQFGKQILDALIDDVVLELALMPISGN
ncbi:unnamed protein product [Cuscuta campestris]|uniref:DUF3741 domain-containing protein n=1 Tax=Cuscuta campestris TaxID=132261 RepID=A0A484L4F2_9ASTE|nr:unnamed protein product [Cuscuta campestris]